MEARVGIEPTHKGFADLSLTTWVPRPSGTTLAFQGKKVHRGKAAGGEIKMERETRVELATSTLARSRSTTELLPLSETIVPFYQPNIMAAGYSLDFEIML
jgi:hypothetical protein